MNKLVARTVVVLVALLVAVGCSAGKLRPATPDAPANQDGEITYCAGGAPPVRNARRDDAYRKMREHCGGEYEIVNEIDERGAMCPKIRRLLFKCVDEPDS